MIKSTGKEFKKFYIEEWPPNHWHEEEIIIVNNKELSEEDYDNLAEIVSNFKDTDIIKISDGVVYKGDSEEICSFEKFFNNWKKRSSKTYLLVVIDNNKIKIENLKKAIIESGGKII